MLERFWTGRNLGSKCRGQNSRPPDTYTYFSTYFVNYIAFDSTPLYSSSQLHLLRLCARYILWSLEFGVGVFNEFLLINFIGAATAGRTARRGFDLSTGRLADGTHAEELWPLNRTIEQRIPAGICHSRCRLGCMGCALTGNLNSVFSSWECGLESQIFSTSVFLIIDAFPRLIEKRIEQLLHQNLEPTLSIRLHFRFFRLHCWSSGLWVRRARGRRMRTVLRLSYELCFLVHVQL